MKQKIGKLNNIQMSESMTVGLLLAFSGGFMDAYTYVFRNGVFANAQTGNIILFGINLFEGSYRNSLKYALPVLSFTLGVLIAQMLRIKFEKSTNLHWRQTALLAEIIIMLAVSFMPTEINLLANSLVSFACGIQVQSFQKIHGNKLATTMCIGNLRSATELLCNSISLKDKRLLKKSLLYYGVILVFACGAVCGNFLVRIFSSRAILASALLLSVAFVIMFIRSEENPSAEYTDGLDM